MYAQAMMRVNSQVKPLRELAIRALCWVALARRRLSVQELQYAVAACALDDDDEEIDEDSLDTIDVLTVACAGLLIVVESLGPEAAGTSVVQAIRMPLPQL